MIFIVKSSNLFTRKKTRFSSFLYPNKVVQADAKLIFYRRLALPFLARQGKRYLNGFYKGYLRVCTWSSA